jgi:hypothetical protein
MNEVVLQFVRLALQILSDRLLTIIVLVLCFTLAWYTVTHPDLIRLGTTMLFSVFSYLLIKNKEGKQDGIPRQEG